MTSGFHERFGLDVGQAEARRRFTNRVYNAFFRSWWWGIHKETREHIKTAIVSAIGERDNSQVAIWKYLGDSFLRSLQALEVLVAKRSHESAWIDTTIRSLLEDSEVDLGVSWDGKRFIPSGAKLLDRSLVDDVLGWMRGNQYNVAVAAFEKGLSHYMHAEARPELHADVVTDMYEAIESVAQVVTERPGKDLSANRELFLSRVGASDAYKSILKEYIEYANDFRHAVGSGERETVSRPEAESFMYLTGLFIRLAITG